MRKSDYILIFILALLPVAAWGQAELHHKGDTLNVSANGREMITITDNGDNSLYLKVGGFVIDLEASDRKSSQPQSVRVVKTSKTVVKSRKRGYYNFGDFQLGFIGLTNPDYSMYDDRTMNFMELDNRKSKSFSFTLSVNYPLTYDRKLWMSMGIRPRWDNYVFANPITLQRIGGVIHPVDLSDMGRLKKSKLTTYSLDVPVMVKFKPIDRMYINAGAFAGFTLRDHTKVKFPKDKDKGDFGVNFFSAGLILQAKYKNLGIFVNYSLTPLFKEGVGPRTNPYTIGIVLW